MATTTPPRSSAPKNKKPAKKPKRTSAAQRRRLDAQLEAAKGIEALRPATGALEVAGEWDASADAVLYSGDCMDLLRDIPSGSVQLVVSSPPYNIGKSYEKRSPLNDYMEWQTRVLAEAVRVLAPGGHLCWQVGNYVGGGEVIPLDVMFHPAIRALGMKSRNRIIWSFEHGLHASKRFSGRHETILWFSKGNDYFFDVDPVRVPQKYPNKRYFKGPRKGELSCNPLGKNPGDVWSIPNVKYNHIEKTEHPCQYPIELVERLVLTMTQPGDWVLDPFGGVGSAATAAVLHGRRGAMAELDEKYLEVARERLEQAQAGELLARPMGRPIHGQAKR